MLRAGQGTLDGTGMDHQAEASLEASYQVGRPQRRIIFQCRPKIGHHFLGELVGPTGAWSSGQEAGQAVLIEPELKVEQTRRLSEGIEFWENFLKKLGVRAGARRRAEAALLNAQIFGLFEMWIVHRIPLDAGALVEVTAASLWQRLSTLERSPDKTH